MKPTKEEIEIRQVKGNEHLTYLEDMNAELTINSSYKDFDFKGEIPLESEISPRIMEIEIPVKERISNFKEVRKTLSKEQAINEAIRCLRCDLEIIEKNLD